MKKLPHLLSILFVLGCQNKHSAPPIPQISVNVQNKISEFNDSTFVDQTVDIHYSNGNIFLTEIKNGRVLELNEAYELKQVFGRIGDGPAELQYPEASQVYNNQLLILDGGHQKIKVFNMDGTISHQFGEDIPSNSGFFVKNDKLYGSQYTRSNLPLFSYSLTNNDSIQYFGSQNRKLTTINHDRARDFHLFSFKNEIVAASINEPVIERFDLEGNKIDELYFPEYFEEYIQYATEKEKSSSTMRPTFSFNSDVILSGNKLYILTVGYNKAMAKVTSNLIFNFTIENSEILLSRIIELNNNSTDAWYTSFAIFNNRILAFDAIAYELHEFNMPQ